MSLSISEGLTTSRFLKSVNFNPVKVFRSKLGAGLQKEPFKDDTSKIGVYISRGCFPILFNHRSFQQPDLFPLNFEFWKVS